MLKSLKVAYPIMLGYAAIGLPCGILCNSIGLNALQVLLMCALFYSGAGQFMIPNMFLAGASPLSIISSVSLVNTRQMLYSASLAPYCQNVSKRLSTFYAATVTDESYGVCLPLFQSGEWTVKNALMVNLFSQSSWLIFNIIGVFIGSLLDIPLNIASFAMTSIFICLLVTQPHTLTNLIAAIVAITGVVLCKAIGFSGPAILIGAILGVIAGLIVDNITSKTMVHPNDNVKSEQ